MTNRITATRVLAGCLAIVLVSLARPSAMEGQTGLDVPVIIAIPHQFPETESPARAIVITERDRTVVLLRRSDATPKTLLAALKVARESDISDIPAGASGMAVVNGYVSMTEIPPKWRRHLKGALNRVQRAQVRRIGSLGRGRWIRWTRPEAG